jgi:hypothetical protein
MRDTKELDDVRVEGFGHSIKNGNRGIFQTALKPAHIGLVIAGLCAMTAED